MAKVQMVLQMSGSRGEDMWPPPGGFLYCSDEEAQMLHRNGIAVKVPDDPEPEKAAEPPAAQWPPKEERAVAPQEAESRTVSPPAAPSEPESRAQDLDEVAPRRGPGRPRKDGSAPGSRR